MKDKNEIRNTRTQIVKTSLISIVLGLGLREINFEPSFIQAARYFIAVGIMGVVYYAVTWSRFDALFQSCDLTVGLAYPIIKGKKRTKYSTIYRFTLPTGLSLKDFEDKKEAIEQHLGREVDIKYTYKEIWIEVYKQNKKTSYEYDNSIKVNGSVAFPLGYTPHEELVTCNLSKGDDNTHMLVASTTGGGKSILLRVILTFLITKKNVDIYLMDFKGSEFFVFEGCKCIKDICYFPENALSMLQNLINIMESRYVKFREHRVRDIWAYNKKFKLTKMKHIVIVIDEFSLLSEYRDSIKALEDLSALGRAAGLNIIICTQRPDAKIVNGRIKNCFSVVAGLKVKDATNSRIIIDNDSLTKLRGRGHCILRYNGEDVELQVMYISDEEIEEYIKPFKTNDCVKKEISNRTLTEDDINDIISNW